MDVVMDLYLQLSDGQHLELNQSLQRASYAKDKNKRILLQPNKVEHMEIKNPQITSNYKKGGIVVIVLILSRSPQWQF